MLTYAMIAVTLGGASMETQLMSRGWQTLDGCQQSAVYYQIGQWHATRPARIICVPDRGEADDPMFAQMGRP